jgi:hypothetical protein
MFRSSEHSEKKDGILARLREYFREEKALNKELDEKGLRGFFEDSPAANAHVHL